MATAAHALENTRDDATRVGRFSYRLADRQAEVEESFRLRHRVFVKEMGADVSNAANGKESDGFDRYCSHFIVRDALKDQVVASTRVLTHDAAEDAGGFYSAGEFDMTAVLARPGRFLEIGRTCVHPDYRRGGAISVLWAGVSDLVRRGGYDHLIGCASIDLSHGAGTAHAIYAHVSERHLAPHNRQVAPHLPLPDVAPADVVRLPPLLKAYLRLGAQVGGPPCWDPAFGVADLFMHLEIANLCSRYARHFLHRGATSSQQLAVVS